jgi:TetR/AcrR family transcriptional regulator, transcriptional repressor for nem operon
MPHAPISGRTLSYMTDSAALSAGPKPGRGKDKRDRLVAAARKTVHELGVERTTLAIVAAAADVPVGNVYYYFKTKDELLSAVLDAYNNDYELLDAMLARHRTPKARLKGLLRIWTSAPDRIAAYGCPIGSLCSELDKRDDQISQQAAVVLGRLITTAEKEFAQLGRRDAHELAVALVAAWEGIALLANTLRDPNLITTEARRLERWIDSISKSSSSQQRGPAISNRSGSVDRSGLFRPITGSASSARLDD